MNKIKIREIFQSHRLLRNSTLLIFIPIFFFFFYKYVIEPIFISDLRRQSFFLYSFIHPVTKWFVHVWKAAAFLLILVPPSSLRRSRENSGCIQCIPLDLKIFKPRLLWTNIWNLKNKNSNSNEYFVVDCKDTLHKTTRKRYSITTKSVK